MFCGARQWKLPKPLNLALRYHYFVLSRLWYVMRQEVIAFVLMRNIEMAFETEICMILIVPD